MRSFFVSLLVLVGPTAGFAQESLKVGGAQAVSAGVD